MDQVNKYSILNKVQKECTVFTKILSAFSYKYLMSIFYFFPLYTNIIKFKAKKFNWFLIINLHF